MACGRINVSPHRVLKADDWVTGIIDLNSAVVSVKEHYTKKVNEMKDMVARNAGSL